MWSYFKYKNHMRHKRNVLLNGKSDAGADQCIENTTMSHLTENNGKTQFAIFIKQKK